jgi:osmotically-inducible protein OsmY
MRHGRQFRGQRIFALLPQDALDAALRASPLRQVKLAPPQAPRFKHHRAAASTATEEPFMKTDLQLKSEVTAELAWDPAVNATNIGVAVRDGVVTLSGPLDTYMQKHAVQRAVRRVGGVRGIALDLDVRLAPDHKRSDPEIAQAALQALRWHSLVPADRLKVQVEDGWVTISGEVDWAYQSASAEQCVRPLIGVRGVANTINNRQRANPQAIRQDIADALQRHARREARHIEVEVEGSVVTLMGQVDSLADHDAALGTAHGAKGVTRVVDRLDVVG